MIRNLKSPLLAVVAVLALSAVVASAASAAIPFTAPEAPTDITGSQVFSNVFTFEAGEVKCNTVKMSGTVASTSVNDMTLTPTYEGCTAFGFATAHFKMNGCTFTFREASFEESATEFGGFAPDLVCPGTSQVEITPTFPVFGGSVCTLSIPAQGSIGFIDYDNEGSGTSRDVEVHFSGTAIHYTSSGGACGTSKTIHTDGKYTGDVTLRGYQDGEHFTREAFLLK